MFHLLLIASIYFSIVDQQTHKIHNRAILLFGVIFGFYSIFAKSPIYPVSTLAALLFGVIAICFGIGAGDVKLTLLLTFFFLPSEISLWLNYLYAFSSISAILVAIHLFRKRSFAGSIPLAPAICAAFIWCAR